MNRNCLTLLTTTMMMMVTAITPASAMQPSDVGYAARMHQPNNKVVLINATGGKIIASLVTKASEGEDRAANWQKIATIGYPRTGRLIVRPLEPQGSLTILNLNQALGEEIDVDMKPVPVNFSKLDDSTCTITVYKRLAPTFRRPLNYELAFSEPVCKSLTESEAQIQSVIEQFAKEGRGLISREDLYRARRLLSESATPPWEILEIPEHASRPEISQAYSKLLEKWHPRNAQTEDERTLITQFADKIRLAASTMSP